MGVVKTSSKISRRRSGETGRVLFFCIVAKTAEVENVLPGNLRRSGSTEAMAHVFVCESVCG